eukprot:547436_1
MTCYDAEYVNKMSQIQKDELFPYQIFTSHNCEYIVIRNPSSILSFYSVSNESIIYKWDVNDNSIWSIYTSTDPQQMILSDTGCLTWSTQHDSVLTEICSVDPPLKFSTNNNNLKSIETTTETERYSLQQLVNQQIIWIPLLLCIIGAFCIILCFCAHKICGNKLLSNKRKGLSPIEEVCSSNGSSSHLWIDSDQDDNSQKSNVDINDNDLKTQEISNYINIEDNSVHSSIIGNDDEKLSQTIYNNNNKPTKYIEIKRGTGNINRKIKRKMHYNKKGENGVNNNNIKPFSPCEDVYSNDNDNDDNKHDDDNVANKFISQEVYDDGRGTQFISQDMYVATGIGTPAQSQLSDDNSDLDDQNYALTIPNPKLSILRSDIQEI